MGTNLIDNSTGNTSGSTDRQKFTAMDSLTYLWTELGLPKAALDRVELPGEGLGLPSSYKIGQLAQASIGLVTLLASLLRSIRTTSDVARVSVPLQHAAIEFKSERLYTINGKPPPSPWGPIGGLHKTADGYVRLHDSFPNHRDEAVTLLGCEANRESVAEQMALWRSLDLETAAFDSKLVISALRSYDDWDATPQAKAIKDFPISIRRIAEAPPRLAKGLEGFVAGSKCLSGLRVLEMSRVIAAPLAGRTLAAHGADVLWITSPNLPDLPTLDRDLGRGKRTGQVDINDDNQKKALLTLLEDADVFIQGYRPTSLASRGLTPSELVARSKSGRIVVANMSAYGTEGPWSSHRGFDSLVQTCSGMNVSEAQHYGLGEAARPTPCQALDHAGGYFLAAGVMAALYKQSTEGGSYMVDVSLAGVMKYLRSLGQYDGDLGFKCRDYESLDQVPTEFTELKPSGFGELKYIRHSAAIDGVDVGWDIMPKPLGSDKLEWI